MISIIDYQSGNIASVKNALERIGKPFQVLSVFDEDFTNKLQTSSHVIFPGVGHAVQAMGSLIRSGKVQEIQNIKVPFLGICLGMQILGKFSEEGSQQCLGIFDFPVKKFQSDDFPIPHMGWNTVHFPQDSQLFHGIPQNSDFYFVHSYFVPKVNDTIAVCDYIQHFSAVVRKNNFYAVQFHPEKSGENGLRLLKNFVNLA